MTEHQREALADAPLPLIGAYTVYVYRVFGGKATALSYE